VTEAINDFYQDCFFAPTGDHVQELEYTMYYLKLAEQYKMQALIAEACSQTGWVLAGSGNFPGAINYHNRALKILEQTEYSHSLIQAHAIFFLGEAYKNHGDYDQAIQQYKLSVQIARQLNVVPLVIEGEISLASIYQRQKRYNEALVTGFRILAMLHASKTESGISYVSLILARAYLGTNKPDSAIVFGKTTVQFAEKINDWDLLAGGHEVLSKAYAINKDFKAAYFHNLTGRQYRDSLFNKSKAYEVADLQYSSEIHLKKVKFSFLKKTKRFKLAKPAGNNKCCMLF
jgi:tetratricopeptide (TPR) repeat protein